MWKPLPFIWIQLLDADAEYLFIEMRYSAEIFAELKVGVIGVEWRSKKAFCGFLSQRVVNFVVILSFAMNGKYFS